MYIKVGFLKQMFSDHVTVIFKRKQKSPQKAYVKLNIYKGMQKK